MKSLSRSDFKVASYQAVLFTPDGGVTSARFVRDLLPRWADRFDADPIMLPIPQDIPPEVPRIILTSRDEKWRCEIAPARINVHYRRASEAASDPDIARFYDGALGMFEQYMEASQVRVGRIAGILNRYAQQDAPGLFLARHFCKERWDSAPFNRPESFELHAHKRFALGNQFQVNSWVRCKSGKLASEKQEQSIVLVEQDINTFAEEAPSRAFTMDEVRAFFSLAAPEFDAILTLYYPPEASNG